MLTNPATGSSPLQKGTRVNAKPMMTSQVNETVHFDEELGDNDASSARTDSLPSTSGASIVDEIFAKIPPLTAIYWCEKLTVTTLAETFADYFFSQNLHLCCGISFILLFSVFVAFLACQLSVRSYRPFLFWCVMASSGIASTCIADLINRTWGWGYPLATGALLGFLVFLVVFWKLSGESMKVDGAVMTRKAEDFYWSTILVSNTLGTLLGDFMSESLDIGVGISAAITGSILVVCTALAYFSKVSHVLLFWVAFVLTCPFGGIFEDLLTMSNEKGAFNMGNLRATIVLLGLFLLCFAYELYDLYKVKMLLNKSTSADER